jgi:hypothetical protein
MTIVTKDGEIITWTIRCKPPLATPEERNRLLAESFRQMLEVLRAADQNEETPELEKRK